MPDPREPPKHESGQNAVQSVRTNFQKTKKSDLTIVQLKCSVCTLKHSLYGGSIQLNPASIVFDHEIATCVLPFKGNMLQFYSTCCIITTYYPQL